MDNMKTDCKREQKRRKTVSVLRKDAVNLRETKGFTPDFSTDGGINTDPFGSWTGVSADDPYEKPIQDADDL